jgi:hypothetical protein
VDTLNDDLMDVLAEIARCGNTLSAIADNVLIIRGIVKRVTAMSAETESGIRDALDSTAAAIEVFRKTTLEELRELTETAKREAANIPRR